MGQFDFFVVNVAAPAIGSDLHANEAMLELVVGGYAFAFASGLIIGGRLGDLYGHRTMYVMGLLLFGATSLLCGLAPSAGWLVAARILQGFAAAAMIPQVLAVINTAFPPQRRGWAMGWFGVAGGTGAILGQILGGVFVQSGAGGLGWRLIFLINVPIALVTLFAALALVPQTRRKDAPKLDTPAAAGIAVSMALMLCPFILGRQFAWTWWLWVLLVVGAVLFALVLRWEQRLRASGGDPIIDLELLRLPSLARGTVASFAFMMYFASFMFVLTIMLQRGLGLSPLQAGLVFVPSGVTFALSSLVMRGWVAQDRARAIRTGCAVTAVGLLTAVLGSFVPGMPTVWMLVAAVVLTGFGNGMVLPTLLTYALFDIPRERAGVGSGVVTSAQQFAASAGVAMLGTLFFALVAGAGYNAAMGWSLLVDVLLIAIVGFTAGRRHAQPAPTA